MENLVEKIKQFMVNEARSCSMDFGCITSLYVHRMWGGTESIDDIKEALTICKKKLLYER